MSVLEELKADSAIRFRTPLCYMHTVPVPDVVKEFAEHYIGKGMPYSYTGINQACCGTYITLQISYHRGGYVQDGDIEVELEDLESAHPLKSHLTRVLTQRRRDLMQQMEDIIHDLTAVSIELGDVERMEDR